VQATAGRSRGAPLRSGGRQAGSRFNSRATCVGCQRPMSRAVGTWRLLSAAAMALKLVIPFAWSTLMRGASFAALSSVRTIQTLRATRDSRGRHVEPPE
jgi:hypothetical protein